MALKSDRWIGSLHGPEQRRQDKQSAARCHHNLAGESKRAPESQFSGDDIDHRAAGGGPQSHSWDPTIGAGERQQNAAGYRDEHIQQMIEHVFLPSQFRDARRYRPAPRSAEKDDANILVLSI